jgi:hypothetical protein
MRKIGISTLIAAALIAGAPMTRAGLATDRGGVRSPDAVAPAPGADLSVRVKASPKKLLLGGRVVFKVDVQNHGGEDATDVLYGFAGFPDPVSMRSLDCGGGTPAEIGSALCHLDTIPRGGHVKLVVEALITNLLPGQKRVTVTASAHGASVDPNPDNDTDSVTITVTGGPPVDAIDPDGGATDAAD